MEHNQQNSGDNSFKLPDAISGPVDVGRLIRELEQVDNAFLQHELRKSGEPIKLPKTSQLLDVLVQANHLNLLLPEHRKVTLQFLNYVKTAAPVMHISFSADPSPAFIEKMVRWLRQQINPLVLVTIGLQPSIGAGCIIRTTNKQFDLSLKQYFGQQSQLLLGMLAQDQPVAGAAQ